MVRHPTNEALTVLADAPIERTRRIHADEEGVLHLTPELLAGLQEGDALELPDPLPTCESCWAEPAVAIALCPGRGATFKGATCTAGRDVPPGMSFVPIISSSAGRTLPRSR